MIDPPDRLAVQEPRLHDGLYVLRRGGGRDRRRPLVTGGDRVEDDDQVIEAVETHAGTHPIDASGMAYRP